MIRKEMLDQLKGCWLEMAREIVQRNRHHCNEYTHDAMIPAVAVGNTVNLFIKDNIVELATAGDPCEVQ
jgi:hypothetical protein